MGKRIISKEELNNMPCLLKSNNSKLYLNGDDLIKYLNKPVLGDSWELRKKRLELLDRIVEVEFVIPKYLVYIEKQDSSNLRGFGMEYLKDYKPISNLLSNGDYSYKEKLEICKKICDMFTNLEKYRIAYLDIHYDNILINGNDVRVCDMDSATSRSIDGNYIYGIDLANSYKYLTSLVLSILYDIDERSLTKYLERKKSRKFVKNSKMLTRVAESDGYIFYPDKYLDTFTEEYVEETRKLILR